MIIKIDMKSETALYEQLYNNVLWGIATGRLKQGEKMPTVRQLGIDLGINLHTVNKAYSLLKQKGYLSAHRNKGAVVNKKEFFIADKDFREDIKSSLKPLVCECYARGMSTDEMHIILQEILEGIKAEAEDKH